jgi:sulfur carrier protein
VSGPAAGNGPAGADGRVTVNGQLLRLENGWTVADVVARWCASERGVAVARNGEVVPRSRWRLVSVVPGDSIEILTAVAGG